MRTIIPIALFLAGCPQSAEPTDTRPSVLVITLDTLRADALGVYGNPAKPSPYIDSLAARGTRFSRAYTVTPLTIPAHSSLFTSLWPPRHGVQDNGDFFLAESADTLAERMSAAGYATMASVGAEVTSHHWGFAQGFDAFYDDMGGSREEEKNRWRVERPATEVVADAHAWFDRLEAGTQWFSWIHMFDVHHPYTPPEPYASRYPAQPYIGEVAWTDSQVEVLIEGLRERGHLDNAWVFILSDHGEGRGAHGEGLHGVLLYNATTRIPFIAVPPGNDGGGARVDFPVSLVDVMPTVLKLAGVEPPEDIDGIDLSPWVSPGTTPPDQPTRPVFIESLYAYRHYGWAPQKALVTDEYKLIGSTTSELYDAWDLTETSNLAEDRTEVLAGLTQRLSSMTEAMVTSKSAAGKADLSEERLAQLAALGYVTVTVDQDGPTEGLPDPVSRLPILKEVDKARKAFQSGKLDEARERVEAVLAQEPNLVDIRNLQANIMLRSGDSEGALAAIRKLDEEHPSSQAKITMASIMVRRKMIPAATELLAEVLEADPYLTQAWRPYLHALFLSGQIARLDAEVQRAKAKVPDNIHVQTMDAIVLVIRGEVDQAEPILIHAIGKNPGLAFVNHSLGIIRKQQGQIEEAEQLMLEEVRLHPPSIPARRALVEIFAEQQRYVEQLEQLDAIGAVEPPNPLTQHSKAQALFNLKRFEEAKVHIDACVAQQPDYPGCMMLRANVLKQLGQDAEAQEAYEDALKLVGQTPPATQAQGLPAAAANPPQ
jgi:choline-sulfatase